MTKKDMERITDEWSTAIIAVFAICGMCLGMYILLSR